MPVIDLPYRIENLRAEGRYAYLARTTAKVKTEISTPPPSRRSSSTQLAAATRLRVLRNVTLCDGPLLWDSIREKVDTPLQRGEPYEFFVTLRLFATRTMVREYLSGPEVASHASVTGASIPILDEEHDLIISEETFLSPQSSEVAEREYVSMLQSKDSNISLESLEQMVAKAQGVPDVSKSSQRKRGRKPKTTTPVVASLPNAEVVKPAKLEAEVSEDDEEKAPETKEAKPASSSSASFAKKRKITLRGQFALVQNTPSRVIDVSAFGDTMHNQRGKILDRVRHADRVAQCISLSGLFPIISDNMAAFERAMHTLGPRYLSKISEFRTRQNTLSLCSTGITVGLSSSEQLPATTMRCSC